MRWIQVLPLLALLPGCAARPVHPQSVLRLGYVRPADYKRGEASAVVIDSDGTLLTLARLVTVDDAVWVTLPDGRTVSATVVAVDDDLATLSVPVEGLHPIPRAKRVVRLGQRVWAYSQSARGVEGRVTGAAPDPLFTFPDRQFYLDLEAGPDDDGAALVNARGELVGLLDGVEGTRADLSKDDLPRAHIPLFGNQFVHPEE